MSYWRPVAPVKRGTVALPCIWQLVHEPNRDEYLILGRLSRRRPPTVVLRVQYASGPDNTDIRHKVGSLLAVGLARATARGRR